MIIASYGLAAFCPSSCGRVSEKKKRDDFSFLLLISFGQPPPKIRGGRRHPGDSPFYIRRCRAGEVAKASLLPGVLPVPPTPPSRCFLKVTLKNDALACISEHFCILKVSNLEKSEFSLNPSYCWCFGVFLGILGESKNRQKTKEIRQKITGREGRSSGTVFEAFLDHFFSIFNSPNTVKYSVFAIFLCWKTTTWNVAKTLEIPMFLKGQMQKTL